ncbi:hypothetical protein B0I35DRAFT_466994 [Stachybotrys elegans]|uniref:Vacuolar sorting protein Vps3844 C-terminal domain-containing protein n=1 Tax=Stachybotrys elegans TaxID=80388 RepID=A0A8K0WV96_9HYPO|nr:hypothetical protein B0I35DRAFT_466994 [Stachybotrys elegans]
MKLTFGLTAAFIGAAAAAARQSAEVYIFPSSPSSDTPAVSRSVARLLLLQRLAPAGKGPSANDLPDGIDVEDVIATLNQFGKPSPGLFSKSDAKNPSQLIVMLEGMTDEQLKEMAQVMDMSPSFTIPDVPSSKAHENLVKNDFYNAGVTNEHECSVAQVINPFNANCWSGKSTVAKYDVSKDATAMEELSSSISQIAQLAQVGEMETVVMLLPQVADVSGSQRWSDKPQELRRRQAEQPIVPIDEEEEGKTEEDAPLSSNEKASTSPEAIFTSSKSVPACFKSKESCINGTNDCSGKHGECRNKWASADGSDGKDVCYTCHCQGVRNPSGSVTYWGGAVCQKKDVSVTFWLFAGFTLAMVGILALAIGLLFNVGEEKLPGVIGAGVSRSKMADGNRGERLKASTAKWGAACGTCATAKAKCLRTNPAPGSKCDRCERLYKECSGQVHRPRKKRTAKPSKTAQIEERLNGLVNLLKASGGITQEDFDAEALSIARELGSKSSRNSTSSSSPTYDQGHDWIVPETYNSGAPPSCICRAESGSAPPPPASDETLLGIYRDELQVMHPFVIVEPGVTASELNATKPFLMSAIRMVASLRSLRSMHAQMYYLMQHIADHMLIRSERSLELLQGILVILGWYQYHCFLHAQLSNLVSLATSLVVQLNLNKPSHDEPGSSVLCYLSPSIRTNEERRAYAGAWYLASASSVGSGNVEPMRYTKYLQQCVNHLEMNGDYLTDANVAYLVRIQHLMGRISQVRSVDEAVDDPFNLPPPPRSVYLPVFQGELEGLRNSMPERLHTDSRLILAGRFRGHTDARPATIQLHLHTAVLRLYEPPHLSTYNIMALAQSLSPGSPCVDTILDEMYRSRSALLDWVNAWIAIPAAEYHRQTAVIGAQIVYAVGMLGRWARLTTSNSVQRRRAETETQSGVPGATSDATIGASSGSEAQNTVASVGTNPSVIVTQGQGHSKEPCELTNVAMRHDADPALPGAVAMLHVKLRSRPDLAIDIPGLLSAICARLEAASASVQGASADAGLASHNIWSMGALKVRLARAKMDRWADMISERMKYVTLEDGQQVPSAGSEQPRDTDMMLDELDDLWTLEMPIDDAVSQNAASNLPWTSDLLQGMDPALLFNGYWDWESSIMNSMGSAEQ